MLEHARALLRAVGYGSGSAPFVEMGIGIDAGEAFVGNIGQRALFDFTAVGDVVNTASRLQGQPRRRDHRSRSAWPTASPGPSARPSRSS